MNETQNNKYLNDSEDEIDLLAFFNALLERRWTIVSLTAFMSTFGVIYSLLLPNLYESKAMLAPVNSTSVTSAGLGGYKSLAGLAGIGLSSADNMDNTEKALQKIRSLSFFENNILTNIFLPELMAVKSWNSETNMLNFDSSIFDTNNNTWVRDYSFPMQQIPSPQESYEVFTTEHLNLIEDKESGFITLSIKHSSPFVAKKWAELVVNEVNSYYRKKDKLESEKAVNYLNQQILMTNLSEIKEVLAQLLQEETKKLTLIEANEYYVFEYIDPPAVMEKKSEPNRALIIILSVLLGGLLSTLFVIIRHYVFGNKT
jgi:LPS O-antigen subunit length determinant protein (WzzB/FepE family)